MDLKTPPNTYSFDTLPPPPLRRLKFAMKTMSRDKGSFPPKTKMPKLTSMRSVVGEEEEVKTASAALMTDGDLVWQDSQVSPISKGDEV